MRSADARTTWSRPPLIQNPWLRWGLYLGLAAYLVAAITTLDVNWQRVIEGLGNSWNMIGAFLTPDFTTRSRDIWQGMEESLTMTVTATVVGCLLAIPIGLGAARNIAPLPVYAICRSVIAIARAFQEIIIAIVLVAMFGFGPFAGFLTLSFATIGLMAKLLADDIEDIQEAQAEAIRATGASWWQVINYGIQPQVMPRLIGLALYRLDINFRESAVIGIVGAGGIGATLNTAMSRYDYDTAGAILFLIIVVVLIAEYASSYLRKWAQ